MFAFQHRARTETSRPEAHDTAVVSRPNPVWPSRALRPPSRQGSSTAGAATDTHEREADRVAERVLQTPDLGRGPGDHISSSGDAMDPATRGFMERRLGHDFGQVHIHADDRAAEATRAFSARAFAAGEHIYFARDNYAPASREGQRLLAHELAHVVQQRRLGQSLVQAQAVPGAQIAGPIDQARSDVIAALDRTVERVSAAISDRDGIGIVPHDVDEALCQFFPGFGDVFLDDVLARVQPMSGWIPSIPVLRVPSLIPARFRDAALLQQNPPGAPGHAVVRREYQRMDPGDDYVALFDAWYQDPSLQATRLLHEIFHYSFDRMYHNGPLNDAFAWQGFVSSVGGLATGAILQGRFPLCP